MAREPLHRRTLLRTAAWSVPAVSLAAAAPAFASSPQPPGVLAFSGGGTSAQPVVFAGQTYYDLVFQGASVGAEPAGTNPGPRVVTMTVTFQPSAGGSELYWSGTPLAGWTAGSGMPSEAAVLTTVVLVSQDPLVFGSSLALNGASFGTNQPEQFGTFNLTFSADDYYEVHATFSTPPAPAGGAAARGGGGPARPRA